MTTEPDKLIVTERADTRQRWRRWFVACWPLLRVLLQTAAAGAMLWQREDLALMIGGVSMLLEMVQDQCTGGRGCSCCRP